MGSKQGLAVLASLAATVAAPAIADDGYRFTVTSVVLTDLGTLGGIASVATDVNDSGVIVGWSNNANTIKVAFVHNGTTMSDIGTPIGGTSEATGINNASRVVGFRTLTGAHRGFQWNAGAVTWLANIPPGGTTAVNTFPKAISDASVARIVGQRTVSWPGGPSTQAVLWSVATASTFVPLYTPAPDMSSFVNDVNVHGTSVGHSWNLESAMLYEWSPSTGVRAYEIPHVRATGCGDGTAYGINDAGAVVGYEFCDGTAVANGYWWNGDFSVRPRILGQLSGGQTNYPREVNNDNFIAGYANRRDVTVPPSTTALVDHAYVYHRDFGFHVLPRPAGMASSSGCFASSLNNRPTNGVITVVGGCHLPGGVRAMRWRVSTALVPR